MSSKKLRFQCRGNLHILTRLWHRHFRDRDRDSFMQLNKSRISISLKVLTSKAVIAQQSMNAERRMSVSGISCETCAGSTTGLPKQLEIKPWFGCSALKMAAIPSINISDRYVLYYPVNSLYCSLLWCIITVAILSSFQQR